MTAAATSRSLRFDSPQQEAFLALWRTYDRLRALEDELFARFDLTPQQYNVLRLLAAEYPRSLPTLQVASRLVSRAPDVTRMLDKLAERRLIQRKRSNTDRRSVHVAIAAAGKALIAKIAQPLAECHNRQLGHLSDADLARLTSLLQKARRPHEPDDSTWR